MKWSVSALMSLMAISSSSAFVVSSSSSTTRSSKKHVNHHVITSNKKNGLIASSRIKQCFMSTTDTDTESADATTDTTTINKESYDIVKVDLSQGRDYPIYIGDGFNDEEAGKLLRSHITGNRALLITNDLVAPLYLEKYEALLKNGGDIQIGEYVLD